MYGVANDIIEGGLICRRYGVTNIMISRVLPRVNFYFQLYRKQLNDMLRDLCETHGFIFIENRNIILKDHLVKDGVHLNYVGSDLLFNNFQDILNLYT